MANKKMIFQHYIGRVFIICLMLLICVVWRVYGEVSINRLSENYWKNKEKLSVFILDGEGWERNSENDSGTLLFTNKSKVNLGEYSFIQVFLISDSVGELEWTWGSSKFRKVPSFFSDKTQLINDGNLHTYTFVLRFPDLNTPIFDIADEIYLQIDGVEEGKKIELEKVEFLPYEDTRPCQVAIASDCMDVLWGKDMTFTSKVNEGSKLIFYTGVYNIKTSLHCKVSRAEDWDTDGVEFLVDAKSGQNQYRLYKGIMKPRENGEDRHWRKVEIDLSKYTGSELTFEFKMGKVGNEIDDYGVWGNPMIVSRAEKDAEKKMPIFIISCDTLRPDHLLPYGYDLPTSPNLDKFSRDAVVFENAYTTQPFTPVAHISMLTGKYPQNHGLTRNTDIYPHVKLVSEILRGYGYQTAGFVGFTWWFLPSRGFSYGMDIFSIPGKVEISKGWNGLRSVFDVNDEAKRWIESVGDNNIFVFLHNYDVHSKPDGDLLYDAEEEKFKVFSRGLRKPEVQYEGCEGIPASILYLTHALDGDILPSEEELAYNCALYDDCIYKVDQALGDFFDFLKQRSLYDRSMIIVVSDHGESLGEHGYYSHENVYEESAKVVSIIKFPLNRFAGIRVKERTILEDIVPTILEVLGKGNESDVDGCSVLKVLADMEKREREEKQVDEREVFTSNSGINMKALIKGNYKLLEDIRRGDKKLFDLRRQMPEYYDVSTEKPEIFRELSEELFQRFALEKKGWWLCFINTSSFQTGRIDITCSVPVVSSKIQGGVWRTINDRLSPTEVRGSYFLPKSSTPAILQIIPAEDANELKVIFQGSPPLKYPNEYKVEQTNKGKQFYFVSNEFMDKERKSSENDGPFYFWVECYPRSQEENRKTVNLPDDAQETLRNLGYLD